MISTEYQFAVNQYREIRNELGRDGRNGAQDVGQARGGRGEGGLYLIYLSQLRPQISGRLPLFCILSAPGARTK